MLKTSEYQRPQILRFNQVSGRVGLGRSAIYDLMAKGKFPRPVKLTAKAVGWSSSVIDAWIAEKVGA